MQKPAFERVEKLFHEAVELPADRWSAFLDTACEGDSELRAAVMNLLRHDQSNTETDSFLTSPVTEAAAQLRPTHPIVPSTPETPDIPGYQIITTVGRGGMGIVYKALQRKLNRIVALKMLSSPEFAGPEQLERFRTEAELLARIQQPNIIPIHDIGEFECRPYFTMEFIDGPNLSQFLAGRSQEPMASARLIEVLARAIHAVHEAGIIHRDLKPANVLLKLSRPANNDRRPHTIADLQSAIPKITDFGLAKDWTIGRDLTQTGMTMGTPCYMAPEQARNLKKCVGPATDIYSLGAILYEMLTGRPPFDAATPAETIALLLNEEPLSPSRLKGGLPRDLVTISLKCLEKSPHKRYATALDLAEDLRRYQKGEAILARPIGPIERSIRWCCRHPLAAGFAALSAVISIAFVVTVLIYDAQLQSAYAQTKALAELERKQIVKLNIIVGKKQREAGDLFAAALRFAEALRLDDKELENQHRARIAEVLRDCPRLREVYHLDRTILCSRVTASGILAVTIDDDLNLEVHNVVTAQRVGTPIKFDKVPKSAVLSFEGRFLITVDIEGKSRLWNVIDGTAIELPERDLTAVTSAVFSPTHPMLMTRHVDATIRRWDLSTGRPDLQALPEAARTPALSDDAHWHVNIDDQGTGRLSELATGNIKAIIPLGNNTNRVAVSRDGEQVASVSKDQFVQIWRVGVGASMPISHRLDNDILDAHFSPNGKRLVVMNAIGTIRVCDVDTGHAITPPLRNLGRITAIEFDIDGNQVVVANDKGEIRVWELPGAAPREICHWDPHPEHRPVEDIVALLKVHAKHGIDENQELTELREEDIQQLAKRMKPVRQ